MAVAATPAAFGQLVGERRRALGLSQEQLAFTVGVNRRVVGELERGKATVRLDIALRVATTLGLTVLLQEPA